MGAWRAPNTAKTEIPAFAGTTPWLGMVLGQSMLLLGSRLRLRPKAMNHHPSSLPTPTVSFPRKREPPFQKTTTHRAVPPPTRGRLGGGPLCPSIPPPRPKITHPNATYPHPPRPMPYSPLPSPTLRGRDERSEGGCRMGWGSLQLQRGMDDPGREMAPRPGTHQKVQAHSKRYELHTEDGPILLSLRDTMGRNEFHSFAGLTGYGTNFAPWRSVCPSKTARRPAGAAIGPVRWQSSADHVLMKC